jgi:hypothetical protein
MASYHRVPENLDEELAAQIGGFLENLQDYRDLWDDLGAASQIQGYRSFTKELNDLEAVGLGVFAGIEAASLQGGLKPPSRWNILHLAIQRFDEIEPGADEDSVQSSMEAGESNGSN